MTVRGGGTRLTRASSNLILRITEGDCRCLSETELESLEERLRAWQEIEQDGLDGLLGGEPVEVAPMPPEVGA